MRVPERLEPLLEHGVIEQVLRPLMSGKEAEVFLVLAEGQERVAKVYKDAQVRSFQHRAEYTEGRRVRSSREQRAMNKQTRHGKEKIEEAWRSAEVDAIHVLREAGVRVPEPFIFADGVLVMELVQDGAGNPAPRLVDCNFTHDEATALFHLLLREVVKMLCAGIVHADLSDFNVLMGANGPVIIDFPQAIDPARNQNASKLLIRDVNNLTSFLGRFAPELRGTKYGEEMWDLYERGELSPTSELTGRFEPSKQKAEISSLLEDILALEKEARERREALGLPPPRGARKPIVYEAEPPPRKPEPRPAPRPAVAPNPPRGGGPNPQQGGGPGPQRGGGPNPQRVGGPNPRDAGPPPRPPEPGHAPGDDAPGRKRRRRRKRTSAGPGPEQAMESRGPSPIPRPPHGPAASAPGPRPPRADQSPAATSADVEGGPRSRRRRRRRRGNSGGTGDGGPAGE